MAMIECLCHKEGDTIMTSFKGTTVSIEILKINEGSMGNSRSGGKGCFVETAADITGETYVKGAFARARSMGRAAKNGIKSKAGQQSLSGYCEHCGKFVNVVSQFVLGEE